MVPVALARPVEPLPLLVVPFLIAAVLALAFTPAVRRLARRYGMLDRPNARRVNVVPMPRAGGLAVAAAFLATASAFLIVPWGSPPRDGRWNRTR